MIKDRIKNTIWFIRAIPVLPGVKWHAKEFAMDLKRWKKLHHINCGDVMAFARLMGSVHEFRNLFIYRNRTRLFYRTWVRLFYKPMNTLFIQAKSIGGGLYIQHGFSTMIAAESIGENCWINHDVSIGYNGNGKPPVIGNNVMITCGAKVLGDLTVGDGAIIGANAVVIRDVEPGAVMGGVPAKRLR